MTATGPGDGDRLAARLHLAAIHLVRRLRQADDTLGMSASQLSVITTLMRRGPSTIGALAEAESVRPPTMSRHIQRLEKDGLVVRRASETDGRVVHIRHTSRAANLMELGRAAREDILGEALRGLSESDRRLLDRAVEIMEALAAS